MAKDKPSFVAAIKNHRLRRVAMVITLPFFLWRLIPAFFMTLYSAACVAGQEFVDHMRWEWNVVPMRALKLGLKQMWSKEWTPQP